MNAQSGDDAFHALTIGSMLATLGNLRGIVAKAQAHMAAMKIEPKALLESRLYPDMFNLIQQLQYSLYLPADFARHFTTATPPKVGYDEKDFDEFLKSLGLAEAYLRSVSPARMRQRAGDIVPLFYHDARGMTALDYAARVIVPDFHFHVTVAYAILRHNGVPLGKSDYFGAFATVPVG